MIVNDSVASKIDFLNNLFEVFIAHVLMAFSYGFAELIKFNSSRPICVYFVKFFTQISKFSWIDHFYENLQAFLSQPVPTVEVRQTCQYLLIKDSIFDSFFFIRQLLLEPRVSLTLSGVWAIFGAHREHLLQQAVQLQT